MKAWSPVIALPRISACMSWVPAHKNIKTWYKNLVKQSENETSHQEMLVSLKGKKEDRGGGGERGEGCPNCPRACENAVDKTSVIPSFSGYHLLITNKCIPSLSIYSLPSKSSPQCKKGRKILSYLLNASKGILPYHGKWVCIVTQFIQASYSLL